MTAIALVSGFDSQIMATRLLERVPDLRCVHFSAFSNSEAEIASAIVPMEVIALAMPQNDPTSPDLTGRDLLMCSYVALHFDATYIFIGALPEDLHSYRDLSVEYTRKLSMMLSETFGRQILVRYPLVEDGMTKADVAAYAKSKGINTASLVSCFKVVDGRPCGQCRKCFAKWIAERHAGLPCEDLAQEVIARYSQGFASDLVKKVIAKFDDERARDKSLEMTEPELVTPKTKSNRRKTTA